MSLATTSIHRVLGHFRGPSRLLQKIFNQPKLYNDTLYNFKFLTILNQNNN